MYELVKLENYTLVDVDDIFRLPKQHDYNRFSTFFEKTITKIDYIHKIIMDIYTDAQSFSNKNFEELEHIKILKEYLKVFPDKINSSMSNGMTPVFLVIIMMKKCEIDMFKSKYNLFFNILKLLLEHNPDLNIGCNPYYKVKNTPLFGALSLKYSRPEIIRLLINGGANLDSSVYNSSVYTTANTNILMGFLKEMYCDRLTIGNKEEVKEILEILIDNTKDFLREDGWGKCILSDVYHADSDIRNIVYNQIICKVNNHELNYTKCGFNIKNLPEIFGLVILTKYSDMFQNELQLILKEFEVSQSPIPFVLNFDGSVIDFMDFVMTLFENNEIPLSTLNHIFTYKFNLPTTSKNIFAKFTKLFKNNKTHDYRDVIIKMVENIELTLCDIFYFGNYIDNEIEIFQNICDKNKEEIIKNESFFIKNNSKFCQSYIDIIKPYLPSLPVENYRQRSFVHWGSIERIESDQNEIKIIQKDELIEEIGKLINKYLK